jgi:hypothetical protein
MKRIVLTAMTLLFSVISIAAPVRYDYTGNYFTTITDDQYGYVEGAYDTTMRITGYIVFEDFIDPSSEAYEEPGPNGATYGPAVLEYFFTDGRNSISGDDPPNNQWYLSADGNGDIEYWYIDLEGYNSLSQDFTIYTSRFSEYSQYPDGWGSDNARTSVCDPSEDNDYCAYSDPTFQDIGHVATRGGWTSTVVPVPAAVWLFSSALAGLGWFRRKT